MDCIAAKCRRCAYCETILSLLELDVIFALVVFIQESFEPAAQDSRILCSPMSESSCNLQSLIEVFADIFGIFEPD